VKTREKEKTMKPIDLTLLHNAAYALVAVQTHEPDRAIAHYRTALKSNDPIETWDCVRGIADDREKNTPVALVAFINQASANTVVFAHNLNEFWRQIPTQQLIVNALPAWRAEGKTLVVLTSNLGTVPSILERELTQIDFELPDVEAIDKRFRALADGAGVKVPDKSASEAARGLTLAEAEGSAALALASTGKFDREIISWQKAQAVMRNSSLEVSSFTERFEDLAAMENLKGFTLSTAKSALAKGVIVLGVPGTGKSHVAKALGNELGLPCLTLDFGKCFGSLVGESERLMRDALATATAMAPAVLLIDEIEKGLAGAGSSGQHDSGVTKRTTGTFLKFLSDRPAGLYVVATCNDVTSLPPEYTRAERWDALFFVDLPTMYERQAILAIHAKAFGLKTKFAVPDGWTGSEIKTCCRIAKMMGLTLDEASQYVVPLSKSAAAQIHDLREWAKGRTIPASLPLVEKSGRKVSLGGK
jgi:hypothetical protein